MLACQRVHSHSRLTGVVQACLRVSTQIVHTFQTDWSGAGMLACQHPDCPYFPDGLEWCRHAWWDAVQREWSYQTLQMSTPHAVVAQPCIQLPRRLARPPSK